MDTLVRLCCPGNPYKNKGQLRDTCTWKNDHVDKEAKRLGWLQGDETTTGDTVTGTSFCHTVFI